MTAVAPPRFGGGKLSVAYQLATIDLAMWASGLVIWEVVGPHIRILEAVTVRGDGTPENMAVELDALIPIRAKICIEKPQRYRNKTKYDHAIDQIEETIRRFKAKKRKIAKAWVPRQWKGSVTKDVHHARLRARLTALGIDFSMVPDEHDAWDAIGIGMFALGLVRTGGA